MDVLRRARAAYPSGSIAQCRTSMPRRRDLSVRPEVAAGIRALAEALPPGTAVPVPRELLLQLLSNGGTPVPSADLTVADLCQQFRRKPSAVRAWLERGEFVGAYKLHGRDWRVPIAAVEAYRTRQQQGADNPAPAPASGTADLSAWKAERRRG